MEPEVSETERPGQQNQSTSQAADQDVSLTEVESAMIAKLTGNLENNPTLTNAMRQYFLSGKRIQELLPSGYELHCIVTAPSERARVNDNVRSEEVFPVLSKLFHSAFNTANVGSSFATLALCDAFKVSRKVVRDASLLQPQIERMSGTNVGVAVASRGVPEMPLPLWFPSAAYTLNSRSELHQPRTQLHCHPEFMNELQRLGINNLADICARFFMAIWAVGHSRGLVYKAIKYTRMTPGWLRQPVVFMNAPKRNVSYPFEAGALPNKSRVRERGGKTLAAAVLNVWITKEPDSLPYLRYLLGLKSISIPDVAALTAPHTETAAQSLLELTTELPSTPDLATNNGLGLLTQ